MFSYEFPIQALQSKGWKDGSVSKVPVAEAAVSDFRSTVPVQEDCMVLCSHNPEM